MTKRPQHPSGRPIKEQKQGVKSIWRVPEDGYVIPRLRDKGSINAIGFTARICADDED